jgi:hypothetical protein
VIEKWVEAAATALADLNDMDEIEGELLSSHCPSELLDKLLLFIPSAFAAEYYEPQGIAFPEIYLIGDPGQFSERQYADEPIYVEAQRLARHWLNGDRTSLVNRVLDWSAEAESIEKAKAEGLTPTRLSAVHHGLA